MTLKELWRQHSFTMTFLIVVFGGMFLFSGGDGEVQRLSGFTMGTRYSVQLVEFPAGVSREQVVDGVSALLRRLDTEIFSTYAPDSELSRLNRHPVGEPFQASQALLEVLTLAQEINKLTGGAFDVTVGPLVNLWGFGPGSRGRAPTVPSDELIAENLANVGAGYLQINRGDGTLLKRRRIYVDLSAIAKGYAVDEVAAYLESLGISDYFLEIGGELKISGQKSAGENWVPAIETPRDGSPQVYRVFYSNGETLGVAGSGDYRNYFEQDGVRYSHEIDPRTGRPVAHNLAAAFVLDSSTARADALATAFMIMGPDAARRLISQRSQAAVLIFRGEDGGFEDFVSGAFMPYLQDR